MRACPLAAAREENQTAGGATQLDAAPKCAAVLYCSPSCLSLQTFVTSRRDAKQSQSEQGK
jgi:hypothetical protein